MLPLPRIALGTIQIKAQLQPVLCGLLDVLERNHWHAQSFLSQAHLPSGTSARCITGRSQRHLDSWLMSKATCRELFEHGSQAADISVVEGCFPGAMRPEQKANLETLCQWLDLPPIVVIDVQAWQRCALPKLPEGVAGIVLDRVRDAADACRWQTELEALLDAPVVGWLDEASALRTALLARKCGSPCRDLCRALGQRLLPNLRLDRLFNIARSRPALPSQQRLFAPHDGDDTINIAVAFDDAFQGYFADTLDLLEARGARICDFSPLRSEALPWETDVVYLGSGPAERYAEALARNHCMKQALRNFVAQGGRVYAEGAGFAYLCERMQGIDGRQHGMVGLLPAVAASHEVTEPARPVEVTFNQHSWLGQRGTCVRGYVDGAWNILPGHTLTSIAAEAAHSCDFVGTERVIGCRMQVDFAGQPHLVSSFFRPRLGALVGVE